MTDRQRLRRTATHTHGWFCYPGPGWDVFHGRPWQINAHFDEHGRFVRAVLYRLSPPWEVPGVVTGDEAQLRVWLSRFQPAVTA